VPAAKESKAAAAADETERAVAAHNAIVIGRKDELLAAVLADHEAMTAAVEGEVDGLAVAAREQVGALEQTIARRRQLDVLASALNPRGLHGRDAAFVPAIISRRARDPLPARQRALIEALLGACAPRRVKADDELTAAERAQVEAARAAGQRAPVFERDEYVAHQRQEVVA
jgi:hypothetical protein